MERMRNKDLENAWAVQGIRQEKCAKLEEENKKLNEKVRFLEECLDRKEKLNEGYRREIKDHQLYEEKLEHRIIEFEELLHGE